MKVIKTIFKIIMILIVVFLATGLLIKETSYITEIKINKPVSEVFKTFNDTSKINNWMPEVTSFIEVDARPGIVGSVYKIILKNEEELIEMTEKVLAYIPNKKATFSFNIDDMLKIDDYNFRMQDSITVITKNTIYKSDAYLMQCMFPYFKKMFMDEDQKYLDNFKAYIEKQ